MKNKKGYFIIEALLSIVIFTTLLLSLFSMISFLQRRVVRSSFESDAGLLLQEGTEIARTSLLSNWNSYTSGVYHPVFNADSETWDLAPNEEADLQARYKRKIEISQVCRDAAGERLTMDGGCAGEIDKYTKSIVTTLEWEENSETQSLSAELLVLNLNVSQ